MNHDELFPRRRGAAAAAAASVNKAALAALPEAGIGRNRRRCRRCAFRPAARTTRW